MVAMMMGGEDVAERPAPGFQVAPDGVRIWRIDGGGGAAGGFVNQHAIIVGPADELVNFKVGHAA